MKLLPYEKFSLATTYKPVEVAALVLRETEQRPVNELNFDFNPSTRPYIGMLNGLCFKISRSIGYRNSFLPVINGNINPAENGSIVKIKMRLSHPVLIFTCLVLGTIVFVGVTFAFHQFKTGIFDSIILAPIGMFVFVYGLMMISFKLEANRSKLFFRRLLAKSA
jgi:hypothetical protein